MKISVGILAELKDNERRHAIAADLDKVAEALAWVGLMRHFEPAEVEPWSVAIDDPTALRRLRRIAAYRAMERELPPPTADDLANDPVVTECYEDRIAACRFAHLMHHEDAGYYVPLDFMPVVFVPADVEIPGRTIGSSYRLRDECEELAAVLELPLTLALDDKQVSTALARRPKRGAGWKRYAVESQACLALYHAACRSIESGAAIVFC